MITYVQLNGFRSLRNFEIELHRGLNVLIGPNGSGKSNIVSFFSFLSHIMAHSLSDAISSIGGAGSFFQKVGTEKFADTMTATVWGSLRAEKEKKKKRNNWEELFSAREDNLDYRYSFTVKASSDFTAISFIAESICFKKAMAGSVIGERQGSNDLVHWDFVLDKFLDGDGKMRAQLRKTPKSESSGFQYAVLFEPSNGRSEEPGKQSADFVSAQLQNMAIPDTSLLSVAGMLFPSLGAIRSDLTGGEILNIVPNIVKRSEDSAAAPGVRNDGAGVAATLYRLANPVTRTYDPWLGIQPKSSFDEQVPDKARVFSRIERLLKLINPSIERLIVNNDPFDNRIKISIQIKAAGSIIDLPFSAISDGTAKWIALVTAIMTSGSIFAIEEPENFVHPLMQREIVSIMRDSTLQKETLSLVLMTTHSETLLNVVNPDEVVVIEMKDGFTRGSRPADAESLGQLIRETGFGLGHFYITGALSDG